MVKTHNINLAQNLKKKKKKEKKRKENRRKKNIGNFYRFQVQSSHKSELWPKSHTWLKI